MWWVSGQVGALKQPQCERRIWVEKFKSSQCARDNSNEKQCCERDKKKEKSETYCFVVAEFFLSCRLLPFFTCCFMFTTRDLIRTIKLLWSEELHLTEWWLLSSNYTDEPLHSLYLHNVHALYFSMCILPFLLSENVAWVKTKNKKSKDVTFKGLIILSSFLLFEFCKPFLLFHIQNLNLLNMFAILNML